MSVLKRLFIYLFIFNQRKVHTTCKSWRQWKQTQLVWLAICYITIHVHLLGLSSDKFMKGSCDMFTVLGWEKEPQRSATSNLHVQIRKITWYACRPGDANRNQRFITYHRLAADGDHFNFWLAWCHFCTCRPRGPGRGFPHLFLFLFVIVLSFPFLPSLSFCATLLTLSLSVSSVKPLWFCPQDCKLNSDWRVWSAHLPCTSDQGMCHFSH